MCIHFLAPLVVWSCFNCHVKTCFSFMYLTFSPTSPSYTCSASNTQASLHLPFGLLLLLVPSRDLVTPFTQLPAPLFSHATQMLPPSVKTKASHPLISKKSSGAAQKVRRCGISISFTYLKMVTDSVIYLSVCLVGWPAFVSLSLQENQGRRVCLLPFISCKENRS